MKDSNNLIAGIDYPKTFLQLEEWFCDETDCLHYISKLRWPKGFVCPSCGFHPENPSVMKRGLFLCTKCKKQTSAIAGTIFHKTRKPLRTWFLAMWFVTSQKHGTSALGMQRVLGLGSYNTAWNWLHKLRRAMVCRERDLLTGIVEVDETYVGGVSSGIRGRGATHKSIVAIAAEVRGSKAGRIRMAVVPDVSSNSLHDFILNHVTKEAQIRSDGWKGYNGLKKLGYGHSVTNISKNPNPAHIIMPHVHRVASLFDRWWLGIHQGAIMPEHLDYYLDEFTFRFNRRSSTSRGLLFYRLLEQAVKTDPVPRKNIVGGKKTTYSSRLS